MNLNHYLLQEYTGSLITILVLIDQISKIYIKLNFPLNLYGTPAIIDWGYFKLLFVENQGMAMGVGECAINTLSRLFIEQFSPNLTFVMDLKVEEGLKRTEARAGGEDRYESINLSFHEKVREAFLEIAANETDRCVVIDSMQSVERISRQVIDLVEQRFEI